MEQYLGVGVPVEAVPAGGQCGAQFGRVVELAVINQHVGFTLPVQLHGLQAVFEIHNRQPRVDERRRQQQDRPGYANDIALQVDEWRRENGIPFDKSTIAASPSEVDGGEFDTMDEALRYLYTCLNFPDSVLC